MKHFENRVAVPDAMGVNFSVNRCKYISFFYNR